MDTVIFIPARIGSTRLPNKMLADINGIPLIGRVVRQAVKANITPVYVACDSTKIANIANKYGAKAIMTDANLACGTDRLYQGIVQLENYQNIKHIINIQGDLPNISSQVISQVLKPLNHGFDVATVATPVSKTEQYANPSVVKVVLSKATEEIYKALYFSRSIIPYNSDIYYAHVGIYAYSKLALEKFVKLPMSKLEECEKLEQLRLLEANISIGVTLTDETPISIDTLEDLTKARLEIFN